MKALRLLLVALLLVAILATPGLCKKNWYGMHQVSVCTITDVHTETNWSANLVGQGGYIEDYLNDRTDVLLWTYQRGCYPIVRLENDPLHPNAGQICAYMDILYNWKQSSAYANYPLIVDIWNEPCDARDYMPPAQYADLLVTCYNHAQAIDTNNTLLVGTPGQAGGDFWRDCMNHNPAVANSFDIYCAHPYPEAFPPSYNYHDDEVYVNTLTIDAYLGELDAFAQYGRRGFPVIITETDYGDGVGGSIEGYPKTDRNTSASYMVDAFANYWGKWPEMKAVCPFLLQGPGWEPFAWVAGGSGDNNGVPTAPYPIYTQIAAVTKPANSFNPVDTSAKGIIKGTVRDASTGNVIKYATLYTPDYQYGGVSLYDGIYQQNDVPPGTYTLTCSKKGYATQSKTVTVVANQTTVTDYNMTYTGGGMVGIYFQNGNGYHNSCDGCNIGGSYIGQTFKTPADCAYITWASCMCATVTTIKFSILTGPTGTQIGPSITVPVQSGVQMIGASWGPTDVPVSPNTTYFLKVERVDGQSIYCFMDDDNPYPDGCAYTQAGTQQQPGWDMWACIKGRKAVVSQIQTGTLSGNIKNSSSQNISGATVSINLGGYTGTTDANGNYTINSVPVGTYNVTASATGYVASTQTGKTVNQNQTTTVNFTLSATPKGTIAGNVKTNGGVNLSGATVTTNTGGYSATTDASGNYSIGNVATGTYSVTASKAGYGSSTNNGVVVNANATTTSNFTCVLNGIISNGDFESGFTSGVGTGWSTWTSGWSNPITFTDETTVKNSGAHAQRWGRADRLAVHGGIYQRFNTISGHQYRVQCWERFSATDTGAWLEFGYDTTGQTTNAEASTVHYTKLESGGQNTWLPYQQDITATGTYISIFSKFGQAAQGGNGPNYAYLDDVSVVDLTGGGPTPGTLTGNVKNNSGTNLSGATVTTSPATSTATTDANGNYTISNVTAGTYAVSAAKSGYITGNNTNVVINSGQTTTSNFTLAPNNSAFVGVINGSFEAGYSNDPDTDHQTAANWHGVNIGTQNAKWGGYYGTYHSASWSQGAWESSYTVAYYQVCPNANIGSSYTASVWVKSTDTSENFWVGIDPTGGTSATSANVQWSAVSAPGTTWTQISKSATASSTNITMFIKAQNTLGANRYVYFDDAAFVGP